MSDHSTNIARDYQITFPARDAAASEIEYLLGEIRGGDDA